LRSQTEGGKVFQIIAQQKCGIIMSDLRYTENVKLIHKMAHGPQKSKPQPNYQNIAAVRLDFFWLNKNGTQSVEH